VTGFSQYGNERKKYFLARAGRLGPQPAAVRRNNSVTNEQPSPLPSKVRVPRRDKSARTAAVGLRRESPVPNRAPKRSRTSVGFDSHNDRPARGRVLTAVGQQVLQHLVEPRRVPTPRMTAALRRPACGWSSGPGLRSRPDAQIHQISRLERQVESTGLDGRRRAAGSACAERSA